MNEKTLTKIALFCLIIGLVILYTLLFFYKEKSIDFSTKVDSEVTFKGNVINVYENKNYTLIIIEKKELVDVIVFQQLPIHLNKEEEIEIRGQLKKENSKYKIYADEIRLIG